MRVYRLKKVSSSLTLEEEFYFRYGVIFRVSVLREEEVDELDDVEAAEERRAIGAGVGARLRMDSDLFREADPGCA